ncbi:MAG: class I SAM-dependent methyltransferase [Ferruginibacter sp.]
MDTLQQKETLNYFEEYAKDWKEKASGQKPSKVNVINQRNGYVLEVINSHPDIQKTLDVGCGTGELVHEIAKLNINAVGVDFSSEMIRLSKEIADGENLTNAEFICSSIFEFDTPDNSFDLISANGFLEYISYTQFDAFLAYACKILKPNGSIVLGSRNRLFNLLSMNQYTANEITNHHVEKLLNEAMIIANMKEPAELLNIDTVPLEEPGQTHANTGIDVSTRFQFTPAQLVNMLDAKGFKVKGLCPIHIHGVIPSFASGHKETHFQVSNLLSAVGNDDKASRNKLIPLASSFMIHASKS